MAVAPVHFSYCSLQIKQAKNTPMSHIVFTVNPMIVLVEVAGNGFDSRSIICEADGRLSELSFQHCNIRLYLYVWIMGNLNRTS